MSDPRDVDIERARQLMMAALDEEISTAERQELDRALREDDTLRAEWERMRTLKEVTGDMAFREPPEEVWGEYWTSVYNRFERGIGWILVSIGTIVVGTYGAWKWLEVVWAEAELPLVVRVGLIAVAAGLLVIAVSVVREKLFTRKRDPYREIQR